MCPVFAQITWDDHRCLSLHVLLFPGTLIELLLPQRNFIGLHMAPLRVLRYTTRNQNALHFFEMRTI